MNEELKIIIRAVTQEAEKNLANVRKELEKVGQTSKSSGQVVDQALRSMGKGALAAVAGITALTTAMVALGKSSMEFRKVQAQLVAGFASVGLSAEQAGETYKQLYGFLGDRGQAGEAANLLAQLTQEESELTEWTNILMGVYAKFPSSLPVESLAEAANHTAQLGEVQGTLADALEWVGVNVESFNAALANTNSLAEREALIRNTLNALYGGAAAAYSQANQALIAYNQSQVAVDQALVDATAYVIPLMTALNNLSATLLSTLKPAFETVASVIIVFVQWIIAAIKAVGSFFGIFSNSGKKASQEVTQSINGIKTSTGGAGSGINNMTKSLNGATKAAKELKRQTMGFDEMNIMSSQSAADSGAGGGGGGGGAGIEIPEIAIPEVGDINLPGLEEFEEKVSRVREVMEGIMVLIGAVAAGLLLWKLADFLTELQAAKTLVANMSGGLSYQKIFGEKAQEYLDDVASKFQRMGGLILIVAGAILLVKGYSDAWVNGLDWGNFSMILGGIAAIVGGIALAFGPMAAAVALVVGGIVALVIGIKDLVTNGYSMEAVIMVAVGAISILIGVIWAFNAALLANPITWIVVAIMALVAAFVVLWNECDGFRQFWINLWEKVKQLFAAFVESIRPLIDAIVLAFQQAWELIKVIWQDYLVPMFKAAWEAIKVIWDLVKPYFEMVWNNIKTIFSVVKEIIGGYFKAAWEVIKGVWDVVVSYFTTIWNNIALVFSAVRKVLSGNFQGAWDDIKKIFSNVGAFFTGVWDTIKRVFSNVGKTIAETISNTVKIAINGVLSSAVTIINGFIKAINFAIGIINAIPGVNIKTLSLLSVPKLATGGITTGATMAMIGERGREAVLPLENHTEWMDTLAERIAARQASPSKIVLQVGEKELGWATINSINDITKQTGGLQLHIV